MILPVFNYSLTQWNVIAATWVKKEVKRLEVGNIITPVLLDGTLSAPIGCPDEEMRSREYRRMVNEKRNEGGNGLSVIHEATSIFIYPHYFT